MTSAGGFRFHTHAERQFAELRPLGLQGHAAPRQPTSNGTNQYQWEHWNDVPCVVLLGEPGSGKTSEFLHHVDELEGAGECAFLSRWQDWCDGDEIFDTLDNKSGFIEALKSERPIWWFLDALDEGRIKTEKAFDVLRKGLRQLLELKALHLIKLRLSCRSRDWRPSEAEQLSRFFPAITQGAEFIDGVATLQLLPLDEAATRTLALEKLLQSEAVERFMELLKKRHVTALASYPLTLAMLLSLYIEDNASLGFDRTMLYSKAIDRLAIEHNRERQDQKPPQTMPAERIAIARKLAVRAVLSGKDSITVPDSDAESDRTLDASSTRAKRFEILETLNTGLFTQHAHNGFRFTHRSFAEYLAALDLSDQLVDAPLGRIVPLFPVEHGVIPSPLRETAAWLAGLHNTFRRWLIKQDPLTAAQGDTIRYTGEERESLVLALAQRFGERTWQREFDRFGDLARSVPDAVLGQLLHQDRSMAVRQMTIEMIDAVEISGLFPSLLSIALDSADVPLIRAKAAGILARRAPSEYTAALVPLLQLPQDQDPQDDIAGALAHYLYPQHLATEQVLFSLHLPRQPFTLGHYRWFWEDLFLERLPIAQEDRHITLDAIVALLTDDSDSIQFRPYARVVTALLILELDGMPTPIERLGPWLVRLAEWIRHHGVADPALHAKFVNALSKNPGLGSLLLDWRLCNWPDVQDFLPGWHVPFYEALFHTADAGCWIDLCRVYADRPNLAVRLFDEVISLAFHHPEIASIETVEEQARLVPAYQARWDSARISDLTGPLAQSYRQQRDYKLERDRRDTTTITQVHDNVELFRRGHTEALMWVIALEPFECFDPVQLSALADRYGPDVTQAIHEGLIRNWENLIDTSEFWPRSGVLPNKALVAGMGFRELYPSNEGLPSFNEHQVDYLVWRLLHNDKDIPDLLLVLWKKYPDALWARFESTLHDESHLPENGHAMIWGRFAALEETPSDLTKKIVDHLIEHGLPEHAQARRYALKILLRLERLDVSHLIASMIQSEWCSSFLPVPWTESSAVATLAAWWLLDPSAAHPLLETEILQGARHRPRAVAFVNALQEFQGQQFAYNSRWSSSVPWNSCESSADRSHFVVGIKAPQDCRHIGAR